MKNEVKILFILWFIAVFLFNSEISLSQNQNIGIGTSTPNASAILDINAVDKGILIPRMTPLEIAAINNPVNGLMAFNTSDNHLYVFDSMLNKWRQVQYSTTTINRWQCGNDFPYGGKIYPTILLNGKCWMRENLNIGTMIPWGTLSLDNGTFEKYCINNNPMKCDTFGGLYQWFEAVNYDFDGNTQGLCPNGWHVATDNEYKNLEVSLGMSQAQADAFGFRGTNQGSKMAFYEPIWVDGPLDMDPEFETGGLAILPNSFQSSPTLSIAEIWTSNRLNNGNAIDRGLTSNSTQIFRFNQNDQIPQGIRCVKD